MIEKAEERVEHLQKAAKFFGEHKDRAFEAKVRHLLVVELIGRWQKMQNDYLLFK
jgi:hypothetical protein